MRDARFSGLVVTFNEERRLAQCLHGLSFCDEVVVADLGSSDASVAIAERAGARVCSLPHEPFVEAVWPRAVELTIQTVRSLRRGTSVDASASRSRTGPASWAMAA